MKVNLKDTWDATCTVEFEYKGVPIVGCWSTKYGYEFDETEWQKTGLTSQDWRTLMKQLKTYPAPKVMFPWGMAFEA